MDNRGDSESRMRRTAAEHVVAHAVWAGSAHLPATGRRARAAALRRLTAVTQGLDRPWVICGDFNAWSGLMLVPRRVRLGGTLPEP